VGLNILADLQHKAQTLLGEERRDRVIYALFSKNGFTPELTTVAQNEGILLAEPADLVGQSPTPRFLDAFG
jgi:hypothetical protein